MRKFLLYVAAGSVAMVAPLGADTWKGTIADGMCAVKHSAEKQGESAAKHRQCIEKCINGGGEYVFVAGEKVYKISNQSFADLKVHAGHEVNLTGDLKGESITVSKIEMPKKDAK